MSDDVNIKISATDNATATLKRIQGEVNSFIGTAKRLAAFSVAGVGVQQIGSFLVSSLREYAEAEKSQTRLQSVLKATGNTTKLTFAQISEFTDQLEKSTGTSGEALNDAAANLSRFSNITGDSFKDVLTLANDMSTVLGTDVTSSVQTLARALNSPAEGLSKLSRLGISFNDVQKAQIEMLDQVGMKAQAQAKILDEIRRQFGGAGADFGKTTAGQLEILNANIGELKEAIGGQLAPVVKEIIGNIMIATGKPAKNALSKLNAANQIRYARGANGEMLFGETAPGQTSQSWRERTRESLKQLVEKQAVADEARAAIGGLEQSIKERKRWYGKDGNLFGIPMGADIEAQKDLLEQLRMKLAQVDEKIAILRSVQTAIPAGTRNADQISGALSRLGFSGLQSAQQLGNALGDTGLALGNRMFRDLLPGVANDIQAAGLAKMLGFNPQGQQQQQREIERSLQATESRFLTRGRGSLSPEAKKQAEDNAKQLAELKAIKDALMNLGDSVLVVEGIA